MIDIHAHIIPGIDDGACSWEESLSMCQAAVEDGIKTMVAAPHALNGLYESAVGDIGRGFDELKKKLSGNRIPLEVVRGAEVHCRPDLPRVLDRIPEYTLGGKRRFFLLELPCSTVPPNMEQLLFELGLSGLIPILVHPERNICLQRNASVLERWLEQGMLIQATAMSFTGGFGEHAQECAFKMLDSGFVHLVASDAHDVEARPPILSKAREVITAHVGGKRAQEMFDCFPAKILEGTF